VAPLANSGLSDNLDCNAILAESSIICPSTATAPAPLLGGTALAGLVALIGAAGAWAVRRRARRVAQG
jgi:hypothetical protein